MLPQTPRSRSLSRLVTLSRMDSELLQQLKDRSAKIHVSWETLLRVEPVSSALANPDTLTRLIPDSIARIMTTLARPPRGVDGKVPHATVCECGCNPFLAYFVAGEQAFVEAAVLLQTRLPAAKRHAADVTEIIRAIRHMAETEIDNFCGVCTHRGSATGCRHPAGKK